MYKLTCPNCQSTVQSDTYCSSCNTRLPNSAQFNLSSSSKMAIVFFSIVLLIILLGIIRSQSKNDLLTDKKLQQSSKQSDKTSKEQMTTRNQKMWYEKSLQQDYPSVEQNQDAIKAIVRAHEDAVRRYKSQSNYPLLFAPDSIKRLITKPNPIGEGTLVIGVKDFGRIHERDWRRERAVWLLLDGKIYPLNHTAYCSIGILQGSRNLTPNILKRTGLKYNVTDEKVLQQINIDEVTYINSGDGENPFPPDSWKP
jgi:hypothetical protein